MLIPILDFALAESNSFADECHQSIKILSFAFKQLVLVLNRHKLHIDFGNAQN